MSARQTSVRGPGLTRTVFIGMVPVVLALIGLLGVFDYYAARSQILEGVRREVRILAQQAADNAGTFFGQRREDALTLADSTVLHDYLKNLDYGLVQEAESYRAELSQHFVRWARRAGVYTRIAYRDPSGRERAAGTPDGSAALVPGRRTPAVALAPGEVRNSGLPRSGYLEIVYEVGVFDEAGADRGRIELTCHLGRLRALLDRFRVGSQGRAFLVDPAGREALAVRPPFTGALTADEPVAGTPWRVRLLAQPEEFLARLRYVQRWTALFSLLAGFLVIVWIAVRVRGAARPIEAMAEGTRRIAAGDLDFRFDPPPIRELRILGDAFNDMAGALKQRNRELEERIRALSGLQEMDLAAIERRDEESLLRTCLRAASRGLALERAAVYWVDDARKEIVGRCLHGTEAMGLTEEEFRKWRVPLGAADLLNEVVNTRTALVIKDPQAVPRLDLPFVAQSMTREFVAAPLCGKDRVFGVILADCFYSSRPLGEQDSEGLMLFASAAGLALENGMLLRTLAESEARYRTILANSPVAILGLSLKHHITTWNRGAETVFGWQAAEMIGKPLAALFPPVSEEYKRLFSEVMDAGGVRDFPIQGAARDGRRLDLSLSWGGAHREFWLNREWTAVIRDVTEAKRLQQQLIHSEKLSAVGQLIAGIAHELSNPLQGVVGYAQLAEGDQGAPLREDLRQVVENAMRCRKIIDNLLLFVRQGGAEKHSVSLADAARASLDLLAHRLKKEAAVDVRVDLPGRLPRVHGDFQQIEQVFVNLIGNACDAMAGAGGGEIRISARAAEGKVRVEVGDTGPGIPEQARERVFEPFFTSKAEGLGTGLGLSICRQIVEEHGGSIGVAGKEGRGALFWFELPKARGRAPRARARGGDSRPVRGKSILVVDDEPAILSLLQRTLAMERHTVVTAASFEEAKLAAAGGSFDLVVADMHLGGKSGLTLFDEWTRWTSHPRPAFLILTGDVLNEGLKAMMSERGLALFYKPIDLEAFLEAARALLAKRGALR